MPQVRKYRSRAEQQAAYRKRRTRSEEALLSLKGLPALPAIPSMPGNARWRAMTEQAHLLLVQAGEEMQAYHDERSEQWQESEKAEALLVHLESLQESIAQLPDFD